MDRRFVCRECGTKWFIQEPPPDEPDLTECGRCGGALERLVGPSAGGSYGTLLGEAGGPGGEDS
jgi:predicted nucleic acid-binding Zn ribbon protein